MAMRFRSKKPSVLPRQHRNEAMRGVEDDWNSLVDELRKSRFSKPGKRRATRKTAAAASKPTAQKRSSFGDAHPVDTHFLRAKVYKFVVDRILSNEIAYLETVIADERAKAGPRLQPRLPFETNIFHWALLGLQTPAQRSLGHGLLTKGEVTRFGRQLNYAWRHRVPPDLLTGFIHQYCNAEKMTARNLDKTRTENWWINDFWTGWATNVARHDETDINSAVD